MSRNRDDDVEYIPSDEEASSEEVEGLVPESPSRGSVAPVQQVRPRACRHPPQVAPMPQVAPIPDLLQDFAGWGDLYNASILDGIKDRTPPRPDIIVEEQDQAQPAAQALDKSMERRCLKTHWDHVLDEMLRVSKNFELVKKWKLAQAKKFADQAASGEKKGLQGVVEDPVLQPAGSEIVHPVGVTVDPDRALPSTVTEGLQGVAEHEEGQSTGSEITNSGAEIVSEVNAPSSWV